MTAATAPEGDAANGDADRTTGGAITSRNDWAGGDEDRVTRYERDNLGNGLYTKVAKETGGSGERKQWASRRGDERCLEMAAGRVR